MRSTKDSIETETSAPHRVMVSLDALARRFGLPTWLEVGAFVGSQDRQRVFLDHRRDVLAKARQYLLTTGERVVEDGRGSLWLITETQRKEALNSPLFGMDADGDICDNPYEAAVVRQEVWYQPSETYIYRVKDALTQQWTTWRTEWEVEEGEDDFPREAANRLAELRAQGVVR